MYVDHGLIQEMGTHEELLAKEGAYYELYMSQYKFLEKE
jgi:ATP-binding cassette subfamily B protein